MHELGIVCEIIKVVAEIKDEQNLKKVAAINLQIGELSDIIPEYLTECFNVIKDDEGFGSTEMKIEVLPAMAVCNMCKKEFHLSPSRRKCPQCDSNDYTVMSGREFVIKNIEAY